MKMLCSVLGGVCVCESVCMSVCSCGSVGSITPCSLCALQAQAGDETEAV